MWVYDLLRFNQTLMTQLMKLVSADADDWDSYLQPVAFAYRINKHGSAKFSPFELMYGVKARLPVDLQQASKVAVEWDTASADSTAEERMRQFSGAVDATRADAQKNITAAQERQKERYDIKHCAPTFRVK